MSEKEKASIKSLVDAVREMGDEIPEGKKQYLLGYAEGIAGMAARRQQETAQATVDMAAQLGA